MSEFLQPLLAGSAIALSVFSLMIYLWLGLTVLLMGDRRSEVTWVGGVGLLLAALFFLCHGAMVGAGVPAGASATDFWWHLAWVPGFAAPLFWAAIGLHYAGLTGYLRRLRLPALVAVAGLGGVSALLALLNWSAIRTYGNFIRMLGGLLRVRGAVEPLPEGTASALSLLGLSFVVYMAACACLPWASLVARRRLTPGSASTQATGTQLWDARDAWSRARPALLAASICMMGAGAVAALIGIGASVAEHNAPRSPSPAGPSVIPVAASGHMPLVLVAADLAVQLALAGLGLAVGWAVVRQGILVERRLPQRDFRSRWRGTTLVAGLLAVVVAGMAAIIPVALPELLVLVTIVTVTYALFTWEAYGEHDRMLAQLRPFISSLSVGHVGWLNGDPRETERSVEALFTSLCRDVLGATRGRLTVAAGRLHRTFLYEPATPMLPSQRDGREWTLPVSDERGVVALLVLGPRADGAGYTSGDLEVARACGQRILDAMGEFAAAQAVASLARRRGLEAELSAALPRRMLHDEVLPRLHLAMLRLEKVKSRVGASANVSVGAGGSLRTVDARDEEAEDVRVELGEVVRDLATTHHDLAMLMRQSPAANPKRLEHGFVGALQSSLEGEFKGTFDTLEWDAAPDAGEAADSLLPITADLLLGATLEAIRNAGRHARGSDMHRRLGMRITLAADETWVTVSVSDDGVGLQHEATRDGAARGSQDDLPEGTPREPTADAGGTRTGLLTHGALLALVGGSLAVRSQAEVGTTVTLRVPRGEVLERATLGVRTK